MEIQVHHDSKRQRFEVQLDGRTAYLSYSFQDNLVSFDHTFVPDEFRGKGVAAALVRNGLQQAREQHWKIVPRCSYVAVFIDRHPEFEDLVA